MNKKTNVMLHVLKLMLALGLFFSQSLVAQENHTLVVDFESIKTKSGTLYVGIFEENNFLKEPLLGKSIKIETDVHSVSFENLEQGTYAVSVFQDLNGNKKLDFETNGIPKEPWAMSGNVSPGSVPVWEEVSFQLSQDKQVVKLKI
jgi:uncharacterized protein (DUF2141 family)